MGGVEIVDDIIDRGQVLNPIGSSRLTDSQANSLAILGCRIRIRFAA